MKSDMPSSIATPQFFLPLATINQHSEIDEDLQSELLIHLLFLLCYKKNIKLSEITVKLVNT